jgi:hypothetical protein
MGEDKSDKSDFTSAIIGNAEKYSLGKQENLCRRNAREYFFPTQLYKTIFIFIYVFMQM